MSFPISFFRPHHFRLLFVSSLAINVLALALPLMTMQVYDRILSNRAVDSLLVLLAGVMIAAVAEFVLRCCRSIVVGMNGANFEHEAATSAIERLLETEPRATAHVTPAAMAQDILATSRLKDYYSGQMMVTLIIDVPFILVFLGLETYLAGWLAIVPCLVLAWFVQLSWKQGKHLYALVNKRDEQDNARYSFITRTLQAVHSIKAFCLEAQMVRRLEETQRESGPTNYEIACKYGHAGSMSYGFAQLMTIAVICTGAPMAVAGYITVGTLIACVLLSGQIMQPLQRGLSLWIRFQDILLAKKRLTGIMAMKRRDYIRAEPADRSSGMLKLDRVHFAYKNGATLLNGIDLHVESGAAIAITGAPSSGKTTLLELMAGIYMPDTGCITFKSMNVASIPAEQRSLHIGYLPMQSLILRGSIMDNLTGFNPQLRAQAHAVAEQLGIEEAVGLLPSGYDTPLEGHMTDVISPGLKQRIGVARALLHKPRLILFDNADHGMDHESYASIFGLMARLKGKVTLIILSEDRNMLSLADSMYDLQDGRITQVAMPSNIAEPRKFIVRGRT